MVGVKVRQPKIFSISHYQGTRRIVIVDVRPVTIQLTVIVNIDVRHVVVYGSLLPAVFRSLLLRTVEATFIFQRYHRSRTAL